MKTFFSVFFAILKGLFQGLFWIIRFLLHLPDAKSKLYDSSFMKISDKKKLLTTKNDGVSVNGKLNLSEEKSQIHSLVIGKSGIGKTSVVVMNSVFQLGKHGKNMVINDMDSSIFNETSGFLKERGYNILTFDLFDSSKSCYFNPIAFCESSDDLKILAGQIIESANEGNNDEVFWKHSSMSLLFFLLKLVKKQDVKFQNFANIRHLLLLLEQDEFDQLVISVADESLFTEYLSIKSQDPKLRSNISATLSSVLDLISFDEIASICSKNTLDLHKLLEPNTVIYVIIPEHKASAYKLLIAQFYSTLFSFLQKHRSSYTTYCLIDEKAQFKIKDISTLVSILRRFKVSLNFYIQEYKQLEQLYGEKIASNIMSNCSSLTIFPGVSLALAEKISRMSGRESVEIEFQNQTQQKERFLLSPREIIQMPLNQCLFFHSNLPPLKLPTFPYYSKPITLKKSKIPPFQRQSTPLIPAQLISLTSNQTPPHDEFDASILE